VANRIPPSPPPMRAKPDRASPTVDVPADIFGYGSCDQFSNPQEQYAAWSPDTGVSTQYILQMGPA